MNKREKTRLCAEFLVRCLSWGWKKSDFDRLETIWWKSEGWKYQQPNMVMQFGSEKNIFEQSRDEAFDEIIAIIGTLPVCSMCAEDIARHLEQIKIKTKNK